MIKTSTEILDNEETIKTSTHSNSLNTKTGSENGADSDSSTSDNTPSGENTTSRPWRVTVKEVESSKTTFTPPTPSIFGDVVGTKENVDKEADSGFSTISLSEAPTERSTTISMPPTTTG